MTENLRRLLGTALPANLEIAVELFKSGGLPIALLSEVLAIALTLPEFLVRRRFHDLLVQSEFEGVIPLLQANFDVLSEVDRQAHLEMVAQSEWVDPHRFSQMAMACDPAWKGFAMPWMTLSNLRDQCISYGILTVVPGYFRALPAAIEELEDLVSVRLDQTQLSEVPQRIEKIKGLKGLDLNENQLSSLPERILQLQDLVALHLFRNNFTEWPSLLQGFPRLKTVNFTENPLTTLPNVLPEYPAIRSLGLSGCNFSEMPQVLFELSELEFLGFAKRQSSDFLETIPADIGKLTKLSGLTLDNHPFRTLPAEMCALQALKEIHLSNTGLEILPDWITSWQSLERLWISGCKNLSALPENICKMRNLEYIALRDTPIDRLPVSFVALPSLSMMSLPCVQFVDESEVLEIFSQIQTLSSISYAGYPNQDFIRRISQRFPQISLKSW